MSEDIAYKMILDVNAAYDHYCKQQGQEKKVSKAKFLKLIGMSYQTATNYQTGLSPNKVLMFAEKIQEVTGLSKDVIIKKVKS